MCRNKQISSGYVSSLAGYASNSLWPNIDTFYSKNKTDLSMEKFMWLFDYHKNRPAFVFELNRDTSQP